MKTPGFTLIEMVLVIVLVAILAAASLQAIVSGTSTYITSARNYLEVFREGKTAMERMVREIREAHPDNVVIADEPAGYALTLNKKHPTLMDPSLQVTFKQEGDSLERRSPAGTFILARNIKPGTFAPEKEGDLVTLRFTVKRGNTEIKLQTSVLPRQDEK